MSRNWRANFIVTGIAFFVAASPSMVVAETKTLAGKPGTDPRHWEVFYSGAAGPSKIIGSNQDDVIFGDPSAGDGSPVSMKRLVMGWDSDGNPVEPDAGVYIAGSGPGVISPDGRWVLVKSKAANIYPGHEKYDSYQIYMLNIETGDLVPISRKKNYANFMLGNGDSTSGKFMTDGNFVVYVTKATNILDGISPQLLRVELRTRDYEMMSGRRETGQPQGGSIDDDLSVSPNGRFLSFTTDADLTLTASSDPDNNTVRDVYVVRHAGSLTDGSSAALISTKADGSSGAQATISSVFSPRGDGIFLTSEENLLSLSSDSNLGSDIYFKEILSENLVATERLQGSVSLISTHSGVQGVSCTNQAPAPHPLGGRIAFESDCVFHPEDMNQASDIFYTVEDMTGAEKVVAPLVVLSAKGNQFGNDASYDPAISPDGTTIAFASLATNLADGSAGPHSRLLLKGIVGGSSAVLVSREPGGADGNGNVGAHAFSPDGTAIVFDSDATNLVDEVTTQPNVYLATLPQAESGKDDIQGGAGADRLFGGRGNDVLDGGADIDWMYGGTGDDLFKVDNSEDHVVEKSGEGSDTVVASADFKLPANAENLRLAGGARVGFGNEMDNEIFGTKEADQLSGGGGKDRLEGRGGKDLLAGGDGRDTFVYRKVTDSLPGRTRRDRIVDFDASRAEKIDLSEMDADTTRRGRQHFTYIGSARFSGRPGELRYALNLLRGDVDGDRREDFKIAVPVIAGKFTRRNLKLK